MFSVMEELYTVGVKQLECMVIEHYFVPQMSIFNANVLFSLTHRIIHHYKFDFYYILIGLQIKLYNPKSIIGASCEY